MPLQSSGQIALSQIRNEFSLGSGQIAMSQLYGKGNAPASSGQILMAANFYGTSNVTINATITNGNRNIKSGTNQRGYSNGASANGTGSQSFGSISGQTGLGSNITALYFHDDSPIAAGFGAPDRIRLHFNSNQTGWTSMILSLNGGSDKTYNRTSAVVQNNNHFEWAPIGGITSSGTTTVRFV